MEFLLFFCAGYTIVSLVMFIVSMIIGTIQKRKKTKQAKEIMKLVPSFEPIPKGASCTENEDVHSWESVDLQDQINGGRKTSLVCTKCGQISGTKNRLNNVALDAIAQQKVDAKEQEKFVEYLNNYRDNRFKEEFDKYFFDKNSEAADNLLYKKDIELFTFAISIGELVAKEQNEMIHKKRLEKASIAQQKAIDAMTALKDKK